MYPLTWWTATIQVFSLSQLVCFPLVRIGVIVDSRVICSGECAWLRSLTGMGGENEQSLHANDFSMYCSYMHYLNHRISLNKFAETIYFSSVSSAGTIQRRKLFERGHYLARGALSAARDTYTYES